MLDNKLIESALQLTGKTMEDMYIDSYKGHHKVVHTIGDKSLTLEDFDIIKPMFSIEKFCYYLLSPSFIEKYREIRFKNLDKTTIDCIVLLNKNGTIVSDFGEAIGEYQRRDEEYPEGNETPLIELLSKLCPTDQTM